MKKLLLAVSVMFFLNNITIAQRFNPMANGNYSGVTGLTLNPASIVDSRYKWDLNLISFDAYLSNNYLSVKKDAIIKNSFFKSPYKHSFNDVKKDLITSNNLNGDKAYLNFHNTIQFPLSFMVSIGSNAAIGLSMENRTGLSVNNMNEKTAQFLYSNLRDKTLYNVPMNNDGFNMQFLNWQDVGLTYGMTLLNNGKHFLKAAATGKLMAGISSAYLSAENLTIMFNDSSSLTASSPRVQYGRTVKGDIDALNNNNFLNAVEKTSFGWNAGFVYEFRGNIGKYKYLNVDEESKLRSDKNKYVFRLGAAIMDAGKFTFDKTDLTNDYATTPAFTAWNFKQANVSNLHEFDTALASNGKIIFDPNASKSFSIALPTALSANFDLHLIKGFYINAATYLPLKNFNGSTDKNINAVKWFAVTPRFESRHIGIYIPISVTQLDDAKNIKNTEIGATLRLGPLFIGSSNAATVLVNDKLKNINLHAGIKIGITHGKPSKFLQKVKSITEDKATVTTTSNSRTVNNTNTIRKDTVYVRQMYQPTAPQQSPVTIIINNYGNGQQPVVTKDTIRVNANKANTITIDSVVKTRVINSDSSVIYKSQISNLKNTIDSLNEINEKNKAKEKNSRVKNKIVTDTVFIEKPTVYHTTTENTIIKEVPKQTVVTREIVKEVPKEVVVIKEVPKESIVTKEIIREVPKETFVTKEVVKEIPKETIVTKEKNVDLPQVNILFATNSTAISPVYINPLDAAVARLKANEVLKAMIVGHTDNVGSIATNKLLSKQRALAVKKYFTDKGIEESRLQISGEAQSMPTSNNNTAVGKQQNRRVEVIYY